MFFIPSLGHAEDANDIISRVRQQFTTCEGCMEATEGKVVIAGYDKPFIFRREISGDLEKARTLLTEGADKGKNYLSLVPSSGEPIQYIWTVELRRAKRSGGLPFEDISEIASPPSLLSLWAYLGHYKWTGDAHSLEGTSTSDDYPPIKLSVRGDYLIEKLEFDSGYGDGRIIMFKEYHPSIGQVERFRPHEIQITRLNGKPVSTIYFKRWLFVEAQEDLFNPWMLGDTIPALFATQKVLAEITFR